MMCQFFDTLFTFDVSTFDMYTTTHSYAHTHTRTHTSSLDMAYEPAGGNLTHSKMIRLGQEHTILLHVAIDPEKRGDLINSLHNNPDLKLLNLRASSLTRRQTQNIKSTIAGLKVHVVGPDR